MYGSKRMKDWQDIVRLYQRDNVHLAEAANILLRNVKYEVPHIKKQLAKFKQLQQVSIKSVLHQETYCFPLLFLNIILNSNLKKAYILASRNLEIL